MRSSLQPDHAQRSYNTGSILWKLFFACLACCGLSYFILLAAAMRSHHISQPSKPHLIGARGASRQACSSGGTPASFFIADIPEKYAVGVHGGGRAELDEHFAYASLGHLLSSADDHWDSQWFQVDQWFNNQLAGSPLRTYDAQAADIIHVPVSFAIEDGPTMSDFVQNAHSFLLLLGQKPHLVVLNHAAIVLNWKSELLRHENSSQFIFLSMAQHTEYPHVLGSPYFGHIHWTQGSPHLHPAGLKFDPAGLTSQKSQFATTSFKVRNYADRFLVHDQCASRPSFCTFSDWTGADMAVRQFQAYQAAWYSLHPMGDFVSRCAMMDSWLATSIPVVTQGNMIDAVPFTDILDYSLLMKLVPEHEFAGPGQNLIDILEESFDQRQALKMLKYIHEVRHVFQYMLNPQHELVTWSHRNRLCQKDDAFTFTLKAVLRKICANGMLQHRCKSWR